MGELSPEDIALVRRALGDDADDSYFTSDHIARLLNAARAEARTPAPDLGVADLVAVAGEPVNAMLAGIGKGPQSFDPGRTPAPVTPGDGEGRASDADFAQSVLLPLSFRLHCRKDAGENVSIGHPLRRDIERALADAADRLAHPSPALDAGVEALKRASYMTTERHLSGYHLVIGFRNLNDLHAGHDAILSRLQAGPGQST